MDMSWVCISRNNIGLDHSNVQNHINSCDNKEYIDPNSKILENKD